jgi:hypothetical protein
MANPIVPDATAKQLRAAGMHVEAFGDQLAHQVAKLSHEEVQTLVNIKAKLNAGLSDSLRAAADTVGGFVW